MKQFPFKSLDCLMMPISSLYPFPLFIALFLPDYNSLASSDYNEISIQEPSLAILDMLDFLRSSRRVVMSL
jgi:hypothetical protein